MSDLPEPLFLNPVWHALHGPHRHLAIVAGSACRYPAEVAPFAAIAARTDRGLDELRALLAPEESVWIADYGQAVPGLDIIDALPCVQMVFPQDIEFPSQSGEIVPLTAAHAREMVALTDLAFPGFFRSQTYRMGYYCGIRIAGQLVAMAGERLWLEGYPELSGICTHPAHRGKGLARTCIAHLLMRHRVRGLRSWLHVSAANTHAIELYTALGFEPVRTLVLNRIVRSVGSEP
jgi:ribosomal protein S18 acetylase RimI-like enzyme